MAMNPNASYGRALLDAAKSACPTFGDVFVVVSTTDADTTRADQLSQVFKPYDTKVRFFTDLADAYDATTTNNNDVILIDAYSWHEVDEMLTVSKNRVHFYGMDGGGHLMSPGARIKIGVTGDATDYAPILNTGTRNTFRNLKISNASTTNATLYGFIENGEATVIENCHILKEAGLNDAGHAHFFCSADSLTMRNCVIGQSNVPNTAAGYGILFDGRTGGGSDVTKECLFENVYINMSVGGAVQGTTSFICVNDAAALNFQSYFKDCVFSNFIPVGGTIMTDACLGTGGTNGSIILANCVFSGSTGVGAVTGLFSAAGGLTAAAAGGLSTALTD